MDQHYSPWHTETSIDGQSPLVFPSTGKPNSGQYFQGTGISLIVSGRTFSMPLRKSRVIFKGNTNPSMIGNRIWEIMLSV